MIQLLTMCALCLSTWAVCADDATPRAEVQNPQLQSELLRRKTIDQDARNALVKWIQKRGARDGLIPIDLSAQEKALYEQLLSAAAEADRDSTRWLKEVIAEHGWPTRTMVGEAAAHAAWLLVQHADADPKLQRQCLDQMGALSPSEVSQVDLAYLTDRVLLAEGQQQIFGTQFHTVDGRLQPRPLEDAAHVDQRRAEVGLPPLAEYAETMRKHYGGGSK